MKTLHVLRVAMLVSTVAFSAVPQVQAATKGAKPQDSPGWVVVEEDWFLPFRYDASDSLHQARAHFRENEEKAAANQLTRAGSWLRYAAGHAMPQTKKTLQEAAEELTTLAAQLEKGQLHNARYLDAAIAKASHALAEWHYFKAKDYLGQDDAKRAARHLQTAAQYLRAAADSANHEYGSEMMPVFESIDLYGNMIEEDIVEPKLVSKDLTVIEQEINRMAERLKSASK